RRRAEIAERSVRPLESGDDSGESLLHIFESGGSEQQFACRNNWHWIPAYAGNERETQFGGKHSRRQRHTPALDDACAVAVEPAHDHLAAPGAGVAFDGIEIVGGRIIFPADGARGGGHADRCDLAPWRIEPTHQIEVLMT